jgi:hypothetical protein
MTNDKGLRLKELKEDILSKAHYVTNINKYEKLCRTCTQNSGGETIERPRRR